MNRYEVLGLAIFLGSSLLLTWALADVMGTTAWKLGGSVIGFSVFGARRLLSLVEWGWDLSRGGDNDKAKEKVDPGFAGAVYPPRR